MYSVKEEKQQEKRPESGLRAQGWVTLDRVARSPQ